MEFEYNLSGTGWADVEISFPSGSYYCDVSYLSDALGDFLLSLLELNPQCVPDDELKNKTSCVWYEEPGGTEFSFKRSGKKLDIKVISYEDIELKINKKTIFNERVLYDDFVFIVIKQVDYLLKKHGLVGYKETWYNYEFPISSFLKLKHYIKTKKKYSIEGFEVMGSEVEKSIFKDDVNLLLENFY